MLSIPNLELVEIEKNFVRRWNYTTFACIKKIKNRKMKRIIVAVLSIVLLFSSCELGEFFTALEEWTNQNNLYVESEDIQMSVEEVTEMVEDPFVYEQMDTLILVGSSFRGTIYSFRGVEFTMIEVQGGSFTMGATVEQGSEAWEWEFPAHEVSLSSFNIGETEVTQALWEAVMGYNNSYYKGSNRPVENVSWEESVEFCKRLSRKTGREFRLPTEAEWEFAARGGNESKGYKYSGGNNAENVAWYGTDDCREGHHPVANKQSNELGIYDMSGNVWEWCSDWYGLYREYGLFNPKGEAWGCGRVLRGGSWGNCEDYLRVSNRTCNTPAFYGSFYGLRIVMDKQ